MQENAKQGCCHRRHHADEAYHIDHPGGEGEILGKHIPVYKHLQFFHYLENTINDDELKVGPEKKTGVFFADGWDSRNGSIFYQVPGELREKFNGKSGKRPPRPR